ncbi:type II toxin-antitoxin system VapC family toxin [Salinarimonas sp. NSM]|uniref:type II toxin-antitoxin system VapC family toxin n=1 Tax=Salinarimonas sp. NSM TaxID=3458003 RepID=UPI004036DF7C
MILLDTNVVSETMRLAPNPTVRGWLDAQAVETLHLSSISVAELRLGVALLPTGRRKEGLARILQTIIDSFGPRILPFDTDAADCYGSLAAKARAAGKGFPIPEGYIAAIAAAHGLPVATRDTGPFTAAGVGVVDPWVDPLLPHR